MTDIVDIVDIENILLLENEIGRCTPSEYLILCKRGWITRTGDHMFIVALTMEQSSIRHLLIFRPQLIVFNENNERTGHYYLSKEQYDILNMRINNKYNGLDYIVYMKRQKEKYINTSSEFPEYICDVEYEIKEILNSEKRNISNYEDEIIEDAKNYVPADIIYSDDEIL